MVSSVERNFWEAKPFMKSVAMSLGIPDHIQQTAWKIYTASVKEKLTMGRSIHAIVAASMYISIRIHGFPLMLKDLTLIDGLDSRILHRSIGMINKTVLPLMGYKYRTITPQSLVYRFGSQLDIPLQLQKIAADTIRIAQKNGETETGKDPRGIAAAALYVVLKSKKWNLSQRKIAEIASVTEVTIRTRSHVLMPYVEKTEKIRPGSQTI